MSRSLSTLFICFLTICAVLLASCASQPPSVPAQAMLPTQTFTSLPTQESVIPSATPTFLPEDTPVPSPTPDIWPGQPITQENASKLQELDRWGRGTVQRIYQIDEGGRFLVLTPLGVYYYQTTPPYLLTYIPDADDFVVSPDKHLLAVSLKNSNVEIWNLDNVAMEFTLSHPFSEQIVRKIDEDKLLPRYVAGMAFSPNSSEIAVGYVDGTIDLIRIGDVVPYATIRHDSFSLSETDITLVLHLHYSPDGKILSAFRDPFYLSANRLTFWRVPEAELISISEAGRFTRTAEPAYLADNQTMLIFSEDQSSLFLNLWNSQTGTEIHKFGTGLSQIASMELAPDGSQLTIYGSDVLENHYRQLRKLPQGNLIESEKMDELPEDQNLARLGDFLFEQGHYSFVRGGYR